MGLSVEFPRSCDRQALRALSYLGEFCWQRAWYKTKVSLSSAFQMETSTLSLHTGLPCQMPQKSAWWPPGQLRSDSAGKGSGQGYHVRSGSLQLWATTPQP